MKICEQTVEEYSIGLWYDDQGRVEFRAKSPSVSHVFLSQPIRYLGDASGLFTLVWDSAPDSVKLGVNGIALSQDAQEVIIPSRHADTSVLSITSPDVHAACNSWIEKRKAKFSKPVSPFPGQRMKTINEEADDLRDCLNAMTDLLNWVNAGNLYHLPGLTGKLRALTYWKKDISRDSSYDPLLFRMAAKADLPLPVYLPPIVPIPPIVASADEHLIPRVPRLTRSFPAEEVGDFQDWLTRAVIKIAKLGPGPVPVKEFLARVSVTIGDSHFDPQVNLYVEVMRQMQLHKGNQLTTFMCQMVETSTSLGRWVLSELSRLKLIG